MDVVEMPLVVRFVAYQMFPIARLPDAPLASYLLFDAPWLAMGNAPSETGFDDLPPRGEIGVARRQCPQAVHVFGQYDPGIDLERVIAFGLGDDAAQQIDFLGQEAGAAVA